jgi:hypothetical protein
MIKTTKLNKTISQGIFNLLLGLFYSIDMIIDKIPIRPIGMIIFVGLILSGIYLIYDGIKKK